MYLEMVFFLLVLYIQPGLGIVVVFIYIYLEEYYDVCADKQRLHNSEIPN